MLSNAFSFLAACALITADENYVIFPITRVPISGNSTHLVRKNIKVNAVPEVLSNAVDHYSTFIGLGKNNQVQEVIVDTGSSDLWVYANGTGAPYTFDPSNSEFVDNGFSITYIDQISASGSFYKDSLEWGSTTIDCQFAVVSDFANIIIRQGYFGIGQVKNEASWYSFYPNYPVALKNSGKIQSTAYSLYLDNVNATSGSLVFGAVDTSHYTGTLRLLPILSDATFLVDFKVFNRKLNGVLDSGTSLTYLPDDLVSEIAESYGAHYDVNARAYAIAGSPPSNGLTYTFGGVDVTVPASELWLELHGNSAPYYLTILPSSHAGNNVILGDSFLRSAYVVYDIDSSQIAIAQANWNPGPSSYEVITSSGIPGAQ